MTPSPTRERADDQHHERDLGQQGARVEVDRPPDPGDAAARAVAAERPWAPWLSAPWRGPWPGWCSSAGPACRPAARWRRGLRALRAGRVGSCAAARPRCRRASWRRGPGRRAARRRVAVLRLRRFPPASRSAAIGCLASDLHQLLPVTRCTARSRTGALRGLRSISSASARSAPRVSAVNSGSWPGSSTGSPAGVRDAVAAANVALDDPVLQRLVGHHHDAPAGRAARPARRAARRAASRVRR